MYQNKRNWNPTIIELLEDTPSKLKLNDFFERDMIDVNTLSVMMGKERLVTCIMPCVVNNNIYNTNNNNSKFNINNYDS